MIYAILFLGLAILFIVPGRPFSYDEAPGFGAKQYNKFADAFNSIWSWMIFIGLVVMFVLALIDA